jgi:hypothetical protein
VTASTGVGPGRAVKIVTSWVVSPVNTPKNGAPAGRLRQWACVPFSSHVAAKSMFAL